MACMAAASDGLREIDGSSDGGEVLWARSTRAPLGELDEPFVCAFVLDEAIVQALISCNNRYQFKQGQAADMENCRLAVLLVPGDRLGRRWRQVDNHKLIQSFIATWNTSKS